MKSRFRTAATMKRILFPDLFALPLRLRSGRCFPVRMNVIPWRSDAAVTLVMCSGNLWASKPHDPDAAMGAGFKSAGLAKCRRWQRFRPGDQSRTAPGSIPPSNQPALAARLHCVCMKVALTGL
jgi:hypothetical protein